MPGKLSSHHGFLLSHLGLRIPITADTIVIPRHFSPALWEHKAYFTRFCDGCISYGIWWTWSEILFSINPYYDNLNQWIKFSCINFKKIFSLKTILPDSNACLLAHCIWNVEVLGAKIHNRHVYRHQQNDCKPLISTTVSQMKSKVLPSLLLSEVKRF